MSHNKTKANRLAKESSPYLQQHAYNPVDWFPWGEEAFTKAKEENKPILVSIGYSTCHWCHVMERESFEDEQVAAYMNEHFVNIKVDREERPDVDAIYMDAVMLVQNGQGGWPLNCFLLPDGKPFFGGTYFPPQPAYRRASWMQVLDNLNKAFKEKYEEVTAQAKQIVEHIQLSESHFVNQIDLDKKEELFNESYIQKTFESLQTAFDAENGGFGSAPKFPGTMALRFCLNYHLATANEAAKKHLLFSLDKMIQGGIYDQIGGGFARYTVDEAWLIPHFEKMLYDNALLIGLIADAYKLTQRPTYKTTIIQTLDWVQREMQSEEGGFYAALDADSEGVEGKFYVWSKAEIEATLGTDAALFCEVYDVSEKGNWEHTNILNLPISIEAFATQKKMNVEALREELTVAAAKLMEVRATRIRPGLDDKILLDWNAMMISAYCKAFQALGDTAYLQTAQRAMDFVLQAFKVNSETLHLNHSYKQGVSKHHAFLDDYALLIEALLELDSIVATDKYAVLAKDYTDFVGNEFLDHKDNLYYFTSAKQKDIILHKKSLYDNATPSGNSTMIHNLQRIGILFDAPDYRQQALKTIANLKESMVKYPQSFGRWANALFLEVYPLRTMTIMGGNQQQIAQTLQGQLLFNTFVKQGTAEQQGIVVCKDYTCHLPVQTTEEAIALL